jgi:hypothetical protein
VSSINSFKFVINDELAPRIHILLLVWIKIAQVIIKVFTILNEVIMVRVTINGRRRVRGELEFLFGRGERWVCVSEDGADEEVWRLRFIVDGGDGIGATLEGIVESITNTRDVHADVNGVDFVFSMSDDSLLEETRSVVVKGVFEVLLANLSIYLNQDNNPPIMPI